MSNQTENNEFQSVQIVVQETEKFVIVKDSQTGKFTRKAKYVDYASFQPETKEEKIRLFNIMEGKGDIALPMKDHFGDEITIENLIFRSYDNINEETGEMEYGILTYIFTPEGNVYATSGKSVYFTLQNLIKVFGEPNTEDYEPMTVKIVKVKADRGDQVTLTLVG